MRLSELSLLTVSRIVVITLILILDVFPNIGADVTAINKEIVQYIDCPGDEGQTEVCAANASSFADRKGWYIFLDGTSITFNDKPKFELNK